MALTDAMHTQVSQLYVALFGRAPAQDGLSYWAQELSIGTPLAQVANEMFATTEARAYYPHLSTNEQIATSFYTNVLGRIPHALGLLYWTAALDTAQANGTGIGNVIREMIFATTAYVPGSNPDPATDAATMVSQALFNNRTTVAQYYGEHAGSIAGASTALSDVTNVLSTVASAEAAIDAGNGPNGTSFTLTTANDLFLGGTGADIFSGTFSDGGTNTFNTGDTLTGGPPVSE